MKNDDAKRLVLYYILAFVPLIVLSAVLAAIYGTDWWTNENTPSYILTTAGMCMMLPAAAHILTRLITKEGFSQKEMYLTMKMKGNMRYYAAALFLPPVCNAAGLILCGYVFVGEDAFDMSGDSIFNCIIMLMNGISAAVILYIPAFGEEFGWRAYMMPKLERLMPAPAAYILGGILWGVWHAPLTLAGHNFGTGYAGYPYTGILLMCLFCTAMGIFLNYITGKTGSVMPAAFAHMSLNNTSAWMIPLFKEASTDGIDAAALFFVRMLPMAAAGIVCIFLFGNTAKKPVRQTA